MATARTRSAAVMAVAAMIAAGCGSGSDGDAASPSDDTLVLELAEQNDSGQAGTATFASVGAGRTRIVLELTNPPDVPQPAHVHSGSCGDLGPAVITLPSVVGGRSVTEIETPLAELQGGELVIHAHKSEEEFDVSVACASLAGGG